MAWRRSTAEASSAELQITRRVASHVRGACGTIVDEACKPVEPLATARWTLAASSIEGSRFVIVERLA